VSETPDETTEADDETTDGETTEADGSEDETLVDPGAPEGAPEVADDDDEVG